MKKNSTNKMSIKMAISLALGLVVGISFLLLRENLIAGGNPETWAKINNLLFQDISVDGATNALGIFYIIGKLFINSLQLIIVPMIFTSITLAMCKISDTKKLGRISFKAISGFLTTSFFSLLLPGLVLDNLVPEIFIMIRIPYVLY